MPFIFLYLFYICRLRVLSRKEFPQQVGVPHYGTPWPRTSLCTGAEVLSHYHLRTGREFLRGVPPRPMICLSVFHHVCMSSAYAGITHIHQFLPLEFHIAVNYAPREDVDTGCDECVVGVLRLLGIDDFFRIIHRRAETCQ